MLKSTKKQLTRSNSEGNESAKNEMKSKPKSIAAIREDEDWKSLLASITLLFTEKRLQRHELDILNEKVRKIRDSKIRDSNIEADVLECFKDSILKKGMIVLRHQVTQKEKKSRDLLQPLGEIWRDFYREILTSLQAIFYPIQSQDFRIRSTTLVGFRDMVLFKTKIFDVLHYGQKVSKEIKQMLLVLASEQDVDLETKRPTENYLKLEELITRVIRPYLGVNGYYPEKPVPPVTEQSLKPADSTQTQTKERSSSYSQIFSRFSRSGSVISTSSETNNNSSGYNNPAFTEYVESESYEVKSRLSGSDMKIQTPGSSELNKSADDDMSAYLELRNQRWKKRNDMLTTESLV